MSQRCAEETGNEMVVVDKNALKTKGRGGGSHGRQKKTESIVERRTGEGRRSGKASFRLNFGGHVSPKKRTFIRIAQVAEKRRKGGSSSSTERGGKKKWDDGLSSAIWRTRKVPTCRLFGGVSWGNAIIRKGTRPKKKKEKEGDQPRVVRYGDLLHFPGTPSWGKKSNW